jgi:hypothetical protein
VLTLPRQEALAAAAADGRKEREREQAKVRFWVLTVPRTSGYSQYPVLLSTAADGRSASTPRRFAALRPWPINSAMALERLSLRACSCVCLFVCLRVQLTFELDMRFESGLQVCALTHARTHAHTHTHAHASALAHACPRAQGMLWVVRTNVLN